VILHISDLHFGWDCKSEQALSERKVVLEQKFIRAVRDLDPQLRPNVICITGDLGGRGQASDYILAGDWLDILLRDLKIGKEAVVICPGNHDVDIDKALRCGRPTSYKKADDELKIPLAQTYTERFGAFADWCPEWGVEPLEFHGQNNYLVGSRALGDIRFVVLNSAWFFRGKNDDRKMWLGLPHIKHMESEGHLPNCEDLAQSPITIALFHHPLRCLHEAEEERASDHKRPSTFDYLCERCHVVLTGHTHRRARAPDLLKVKTVHIEAGAAYQGHSYYNSVGIIRLGEDRLWHRWLEYDPSSDRNGWALGKEHMVRLHRERARLVADEYEPEDRTILVVPGIMGTSRQREIQPESGGGTKEPERRVRLSQATISTADEVLVGLARAGDAIEARLREIPRQDDVEDAAIRVDRLMRQIWELIEVMEFNAALEQAARLERELDKAGPLVSSEMVSQAYYCLFKMESERVRHLGASDLSKAEYYLERAHHAQR